MDQWIRTDKKMEIVERVAENGVPYLYFPALEDIGVRHAFSTKEGGVSTGVYESMNLSFTKPGEKRENVLENYRRMAKAIGVGENSFVLSDQTHTTNVLQVKKEHLGLGITKERIPDIDGMVTNVPGLTLVTFYADCIPLYFVDPVKRAIGLSHSGWRGTIKEMGRITVEKMIECYGSKPRDIIAAIGPGICVDCYEISKELGERFEREFQAGDVKEILTPYVNDHCHLNLWRANEMILEKAGILPENIHTSNICTHCNSTRLYSHRTMGAERGNLAAMLALIE